MLLLSGMYAKAQDVTFCYNVARETLEVSGIPFEVDGNLLDPDGDGDEYPYITMISSSATQTTVGGFIAFEVHATDDNEIIRYEFIAETGIGGRYGAGPATSVRTSSSTSSSTLQLNAPGLWRTYFYVKDNATPDRQTSSGRGPDILVTE